MPARRKVLVIGGTGTIGPYLLKELAEDHKGLDVVAAARSDSGAKKIEAMGFPSVFMDLDDHTTIPAAVKGVDTIFTVKSYSVNFLIQEKRLIDAAREEGVRYFIDTSSMGPKNLPYAPMGWNRLVDAYLAMSGMQWTVLYPHLFMDNILLFIDKPAQIIKHLIGESPASWVAAKDIARVAAAVIREPDRWPNQNIPMAPDLRSFPQIVAMINAMAGTSYRFETEDPDAAIAARLARPGHDIAQVKPVVEYFHMVSKGEIPWYSDVADPIEEITGKKATMWPDFIAEHKAAFV